MRAKEIHLSDANTQKLDMLVRVTGRSTDELVNEAVQQFPEQQQGVTQENRRCEDWKAAWRQARGMWKDRDDLPAFFENLRKESDCRIP